MISRRGLLMGLPAALGAAQFRPSKAQEEFLDDLSRRSFRFFEEQSDGRTRLVRDRALADSGEPDARPWTSSAATGVGLAAWCIGAERGWITRAEARQRTLAVLQFYAEEAFQIHGWFYHFVHGSTGERWNKNEVSSIDTALLVAGM